MTFEKLPNEIKEIVYKNLKVKKHKYPKSRIDVYDVYFKDFVTCIRVPIDKEESDEKFINRLVYHAMSPGMQAMDKIISKTKKGEK